MGAFPTLRLGVLGKVAVVLCALLLALTALAGLAVHATRSATSGADQVDSEFAERVGTDAALLTAVGNLRLADERLRSPGQATARSIDTKLALNDARLAREIGRALDGNGVRSAEARIVRRIRAAYSGYLAVRQRVLGRADRASPALAEKLDSQMHRAFEPLEAALATYANIHFREAQDYLATLRNGGHTRNLLLVVVLAFGLLSLLAILLVARGIVARVREYAAFSGSVAGGDLDSRLEPRGSDDLAALAKSLNEMVEQLSSSSRQRSDSRAAEATYRASHEAFSEILQVTESEREAHEILKLYIQRGVPGSEVVVLNRNNSKDRLEPTTELPERSPLQEPLKSAAPRACLAVRLARTFESGGETPSLLGCEVCGATAKESTCLPLLVSGEVIGSVLVGHEGSLEAGEERRVHEAVGQAAPILANLRNLALAEARAATDALTGLPNRRAIQDTLKRMLAESARTLAPMAAVLIDLDHFKQINDTFGHEEGDAVLAAVGDILSDTVRTSDFVGRNGGEEFLALLPDTGVDGALELAEKLRTAIATIKLPRVDRAICASLGVAIHPDMATDSETLLRLADRALYAAKGGGRNRVELAGKSPAHTLAGNGVVGAATLD